MKYYFRLIWLLLVVWFRKPSAALGPCKTPMRVWPNDLDIFLHMNNGAYLTIMDLARTDMMVRSGLATRILQNRWYPVVAAETIRFKKPLKLFQRYEIETEVLCWDHRAFFLVQTFTRDETFVAKAVVEARFLSTSGERITSAQILALTDYQGPSPAMPDWIADWQRAQPAMSDPKFIEE